MKKLIAMAVLVGTMALAALTGSMQAALAHATCKDGWVSPSYGSGTCSHHGGIDHSYPYYPGP
jgi:hypothetical protein